MPRSKLVSATCSLLLLWRSCNRELRWLGSSRPARCCELGSDCSATSCRGSIEDVVGVNPPYVRTFEGGLLGTVGGTAIAPGVPNSAIDAVVAANQTFTSGFPLGQLSCASTLVNPATCLPPVAMTAVQDGKLHAPYFM